MEERGGGTRQRHLVPSQSSKGINGSRLGNRASMQQRARGRAGGDFVSSTVVVLFSGKKLFVTRLLLLEALVADAGTSGSICQ
jgi:hypothetical protein